MFFRQLTSKSSIDTLSLVPFSRYSTKVFRVWPWPLTFRGYLRSKLFSPFDSPYMISNLTSVDTSSLSHTLFEIFDLKVFRVWPWPSTFRCHLRSKIFSILESPYIRAVGLESVTWDSSQLESVNLRLETWLETWAFGLETWLVTWRLGLGLDSRLAANDLDHKSESQVARKTKSLYNLSFDISIKYNFSISCSIQWFFSSAFQRCVIIHSRNLVCSWDLIWLAHLDLGLETWLETWALRLETWLETQTLRLRTWLETWA